MVSVSEGSFSTSIPYSESASISAIGSDELSDNGELAVRVDGHARPKEGAVTHTPGVEIASVFVANTAVTVVAIAAVGAGAASLLGNRARMGSVGSSHLVGLPDIHFGTACAVFALASVGIVGRWGPAFDVALINESVSG